MELLIEARRLGASDVHMTIGFPPVIRLHGQLIAQGSGACSSAITERMARDLMNADQWKQFQRKGEVDFSFGDSSASRCRINVYKQHAGISLAIRLIGEEVRSLETLGLPSTVYGLAARSQGLILVTGPTGSGKSTTLASIIDYINRHFCKHIITLEDPIEYVHRHKKSIVDQREVGSDTLTFSNGLRAALRQDPDVILVGEMRDLETISTAVSAAETGHLVLATLHSSGGPQTIDRIIDAFPSASQPQIRLQLAGNLAAVLSQRLVPCSDGTSRVAAFEVMVNTSAIANLIRQEKTHQIKSLIQTGRQYGMTTMEQSLRSLISEELLDEHIAGEFLSSMGTAL
jgi:twitching motility protein PilT